MLIKRDCVGEGTPVVLLHSGVCDRRMWEPQWEPLTARHRVVRVDFRGFGETPLLPEPYADCDDVAAVLDTLGIEKASLVGSSFGGQVALEFATRYPQRTVDLMLLCPAFRGLEPTEAARRFGEQEDALLDAGDIDAATELNVDTWLGPEASEQIRQRVREMQRHALEVQLAAYGTDPPQHIAVEVDPAAIAARTLVVSGERDMDHFRAIARHLAATVPDGSLLTLSWAGHLPSLERPADIADLLADTLS